MKKLIIVTIASLFFVGCGNTSNIDTIGSESVSSDILSKTPGLEGCKLYSFPVSKYEKDINIVRCPSDTTSVTKQYKEGKTDVTETSVLIEEEIYQGE